MTRAVSLLLLLAIAPSAVGQNPGPRYDVLRGLLKFNGVTEPLTEPPVRPDPCADVLVVVVGAVPMNVSLTDTVQRALANGGAVLVATDGPADLFPYLPLVPGQRHLVRAENAPARCNRPENCFAGNAFYPLLSGRAMPLGDGQPDVNLLAAGRLKRVTATGPGVLKVPDDASVSPLLVLPSGSVNGRGESLTNRYVVAVLDPTRTNGTAVLASNHRLFDNNTLSATAPDGSLATDNFAFTFFLTRHLVGSGDRKRTRCLFIENGRVVTDFDTVQFAAVPPTGTPPVPLPPLEELQEQLVDQGNKLIGDWQDADGPHRFALGNSAERLPPTLRALIVAAVVLAGLWLVRRWRAARFQPSQLPRPAAARPEPAYRRAADDRLESDNLTRPARDHLRAVFAHWGATGGSLPPVHVTGPHRRKIEAALDELWEEAAGRTGRAVTAARWGELRRMINMLRWAADAGEWRFAPAGGAA